MSRLALGLNQQFARGACVNEPSVQRASDIAVLFFYSLRQLVEIRNRTFRTSRDRRFDGFWERPVRSFRQDLFEVGPSGRGSMCGVFGHRAPHGTTALNGAYHDNAPDLPREIIWAWRSLSACQSPSDPERKCPDTAPDQYASMT